MKRSLFFLLIIGICNSSYAQYYYDRSKNPEKTITDRKTGQDFDKYYFFSWDINTPNSNPGFINQQSSLGTKFGFRKRINEDDKLWVGGDLSWSVFKQYIPYTTFKSSTGNGATTSDFYNYSYNYGLTVNVDYFFFPKERIILPYASLGIGLAYNKVTQYYNVYGTEGEKIGFMVRPEIGALIGFGENASWRLKAGVHFDFATTAISDFQYNIYQTGLQNFSGYGFQIGLVKMAW